VSSCRAADVSLRGSDAKEFDKKCKQQESGPELIATDQDRGAGRARNVAADDVDPIARDGALLE
jgi:hypothetical protein